MPKCPECNEELSEVTLRPAHDSDEKLLDGEKILGECTGCQILLVISIKSVEWIIEVAGR